MILYALIIGILAALLGFSHLLWRMTSASHGVSIDRSSRPGTAVLLVDLQPTFLDAFYAAVARERALRAAGELISDAKTNGRTVIAIRHGWATTGTKLISKLFRKGTGIAGRPGSELSSEISASAEIVIDKAVQDGFADGQLDEVLAHRRIGTLIIAGLDGEACVSTTALSALNRGYSVIIAANAVLTAKAERWPKLASKLESHGAIILTERE